MNQFVEGGARLVKERGMTKDKCPMSKENPMSKFPNARDPGAKYVFPFDFHV